MLRRVILPYRSDMAIPEKHTNWEARRAELRNQYGLYGFQIDPPRLTEQLQREKDAEKAYNASIPRSTDRPTSAHERKQKKAASKAAAKKSKGKTRR
jgi:hypothetical protein